MIYFKTSIQNVKCKNMFHILSAIKFLIRTIGVRIKKTIFFN